MKFNLCLNKNNTTPFTPTSDYNPATKKYVDQNIPSGGFMKKGNAIFNKVVSEGGYTLPKHSPLPFGEATNYNDSDNITLLSPTQIKLKAGIKYKLTGQVCLTTTTLAGVVVQFYNVTTGAFIGTVGRLTPPTDTGNNNFSSCAECVISPNVDTTIELRTNDTFTINTIYNGTKVLVEEIESYLLPIPNILNQMLGVNQTRQDVKTSRAIGTTYTNTTGRPIVVCITGNSASGNPSIYVNTTIVGSFSTTARTTITFVVPDGSSYRSELNVNLTSWAELR